MNPGDVITIKYPVLFSIMIRHHYFLDKRFIQDVKNPDNSIKVAKGYQLWDNIHADEQVKILAKYDVRRFFQIEPTLGTQATLAGIGAIFKVHGMGFVIATRKTALDPVVLADTEQLLFILRVTDPGFYQYSSMLNKIEEVRIEKAATLGDRDKLFKKVYWLSNSSALQFPFLSNPASVFNAGNTYQPEDLALRSGTLQQARRLISTSAEANDDANWEMLPARNVAPTLVHYLSKEDLVEVEITPDIPVDTFAVIEIKAKNPTVPAFDLYGGGNALLSPRFEIRLKNRSTWWRYFDQKTGTPVKVKETATPFALTHLGQEEVVHNGIKLPNPSVAHPVNRDPADTGKRLLSDIYL
jgi:hypothetical protein